VFEARYRYVLINPRVDELCDYIGAWMFHLENALEVNAGFDSALVGGFAVVSVGIAREVILTRLGM